MAPCGARAEPWPPEATLTLKGGARNPKETQSLTPISQVC